MSYNVTFAYVRTVINEDGPSTREHLERQLPDFSGELLGRVLQWALDNGSLTFDGSRYFLTERSRR